MKLVHKLSGQITKECTLQGRCGSLKNGDRKENQNEDLNGGDLRLLANILRKVEADPELPYLEKMLTT